MTGHSAARLKALLAQRIVVIDGAMGTMIQARRLQEQDYRGERFKDNPKDLKGNSDVLNLTRPDVITDIHRAYLEAGEPHVERHPVNLNELVERAAGRHRPIAGPRGIEVNTAVPERTLLASGDVTLIEQAVSNLIHNAVRYNQPGGHVAVVLEPAGIEDGNGRFRLRVFDDGPGVPEELFGRLAERSYRADDARTRSPGGQGLGLSIARQVADRHGYTMDIRRSEAGGLEVELAGELAPGI